MIETNWNENSSNQLKYYRTYYRRAKIAPRRAKSQILQAVEYFHTAILITN